MNEDLQKKIADALRNPQNMGELPDADAIGTVGNSDCGEMLRMWVKFKELNGKKVIDRATFQSFGCETAIAVASLATELIRGKTARGIGRSAGAASSYENPLRPARRRRLALRPPARTAGARCSCPGLRAIPTRQLHPACPWWR
jgi:nitrogen fixation NifU-like protein